MKKTGRLAEVNNALKARGVAERLVRAKDYFYFAGGSAAQWPNSGVYGIASATDWPLAEWLAEYDRLKEAR